MADSPDDLAITRLLVRAALAVVLVIAGLGVLALSRSGETVSPRDLASAGDAVARPTIGPLPGSDVSGYLERRKATLAVAVDDDRAETMAAVSFARYVTEVEARSLTAGVTVLGFLVAAPGGAPSIADDLAAWSDAQAAEAKTERADIARMLPTVDQQDFADQYRRDLARLDRLIASVDPKGLVVFGVLVRSVPAALQPLAAKPDVRLVDVVDGGKAASRADVRGLRPEEVIRAADPPTRP